MHEAGLARSVASALREQGRGLAEVRLLVRGGQHPAPEFDASLRAYLAAELPAEDASATEIVHVPVEQLCVSCGHEFRAPAPDAICPACGGSGLPAVLDEQVEIEPLEAERLA